MSSPFPPPTPDQAASMQTVEEQAVAASMAATTASDSATLWVFVLDGPLRAQEALLAAMRLVARKHLKLEDAAIVTKVGGRVRITQTKDINPGQGAMSGTWLGTLAGLFVGQPLIGAAIGAAVGGLFAKLRDIGIDDDEMKQMGEALADDEAALFLLIEDCHELRALREVARFPGRLLRTTAPDGVAQRVREQLVAPDPWGT
ncbi:DUF1269 domain-containing protein [Euzebya tangerina]|uniref:DUF1269 domain-containing protein n=1 Tax=Euzebya tangerina TaxID=591198 RepID=UPI000E313764|nr:DUF1269 domain-containing protein [Euzebya tangerina]